MVDGFEQEQGKSVTHDWPKRGAYITELDNALHNFLEWDVIARLRGRFDKPKEIFGLEPDALKKELDADEETVEKVREIIDKWNEDPLNYHNPFTQPKSPYQVPNYPPPRPQVKVAVKERWKV